MLPLTGEITAAMINEELGRAPDAPFNIGGTEERSLAGRSTGSIAFSDFRGKSWVRTSYSTLEGVSRGGHGPTGYPGRMVRGNVTINTSMAVPFSSQYSANNGNWRANYDFFLAGADVTDAQIAAAALNPNRAIRGNGVMLVQFRMRIDAWFEWGEFRLLAASPAYNSSTWKKKHDGNETRSGRHYMSGFWIVGPAASNEIVIPAYRSTGGDNDGKVWLATGMDGRLSESSIHQYFVQRSYNMYSPNPPWYACGLTQTEFNNARL